MQTAKMIYLVMWVLLAAPLIGFNIKRMSEKKLAVKRRIKWGFVLFIAALIVFISIFLFYAYKVTLDTRYELAAERYIDTHAEYLTGKLSYQEYLEKTAPLIASTANTSEFEEKLASYDGLPVKEVRFQISSWIIPKYYQDNAAFPKTNVIDANNPVFVLYLFDDTSTKTYYLIEMVWKDEDGWKIAYHAPATKEQLAAGKTALPSEINGKWFYLSA